MACLPFACEKISAVIGRLIIQFVQKTAAKTADARRDVHALGKSSSRLSVWTLQWLSSSSLTVVTSL